MGWVCLKLEDSVLVLWTTLSERCQTNAELDMGLSVET